MRKRAIVPPALGALVVLAGVAWAELPSGITRPANEAGLSNQELGRQLFAANCATCHGIAGQGIAKPRSEQGAGHVTGQGPSLKGAGAQAADLYLSTGMMPLGNPRSQPWRRKVEFTKRELAALTQYVASLGAGPPIPKPAPQQGKVPQGLRLFTEHCAGCHQVAAEGGYVTNARVPNLKQATPTQIAEAVRIGPYLMPHFSKKAISDASTVGLWNGSTWTSVRNVMSLVRWAAAAKSANGFGDAPNFGKKKCSMTAYAS